MSRRIYLTQPEIRNEVISGLTSFLKNPDLSGSSKVIEEFEQKLIDISGNNYAVGLSSGTGAIHLALILLGIKPGDNVICQSFTYAATAFPITYVGANPIFIDSEPNTWNLDPDILENSLKQINELTNKLPTAIIYVHTYGMPAKVDEILNIAAKFGVPVIEDAAQAIGSKSYGRSVGQFGDLSILSFNGNKIATSSGGGALLAKSNDYTERALHLATQAKDNELYEHSEIGYNYRIGAFNALLGSIQLDYLAEEISIKQKIFSFYKEALSDIEELSFQTESEGSISNRWLTTILTSSFEQRESIRLALEKENIESRPLWKPMHMQPVFKDAEYFGGKVSEDLFRRGLCLPSGTAMTESDLESVVGIIKNVMNRKGR